MANVKLTEKSFRAGHKPDNSGVAKPTMNGKGVAASANASNSASPPNPGGLNVLKKIKKNGTFKTST